MAEIKNLVFDLGNVIIDIDYAKTVGEFQKLAAVDFTEILSYSTQNNIFDAFERGSISAAQFRAELKKFLKAETGDDAIDFAWNAILVNYPKAKFDMLLQLKNRYKIFALSNINEIHVSTIDQAVQKLFGAKSMNDFFDKAYYSNEMGHRKPDKEIYEMLLRLENLKAAETFFVDDKAENIEAAKKLGFQAYQLADRNRLFNLLEDLKII